MNETTARRYEWEARYREGRTAWERHDVNPALLHWLHTGVLSPSRLLIPGCGRCPEVVALAQRGFEVTAVDIAPSAIHATRDAIRNANVEAQIIEADLLHWEPESPFDAIYDQTCLCALSPTTWPTYADRLYAWLKPHGRLFALFMQTNTTGGPPFDCGLPTMRALFSAARWQWPTEEPLHITHPTGLQEFAVVLTRRP